MMQNRANWFGMRCLFGWCGGVIDSDKRDHIFSTVYWKCSTCGRKDYAHEQGWDYMPEDGPAPGPRS